MRFLQWLLDLVALAQSLFHKPSENPVEKEVEQEFPERDNHLGDDNVKQKSNVYPLW